MMNDYVIVFTESTYEGNENMLLPQKPAVVHDRRVPRVGEVLILLFHLLKLLV
jgi:hypothetical protein